MTSSWTSQYKLAILFQPLHISVLVNIAIGNINIVMLTLSKSQYRLSLIQTYIYFPGQKRRGGSTELGDEEELVLDGRARGGVTYQLPLHTGH